MIPRKWATISMSVLGVLGFLLVINEPLKSLLITRMSRGDIVQTIGFRGNHSRPNDSNFDFSSVKPINWENTLKAWQSNTAGIGEIAIPSVRLKLPIYDGLNNENLLKGAGTMRANEQMGGENYALAGHHMADPQILFSPLVRVQRGQRVYLTDNKRVYVYQVQSKKVISKYQVGYLKAMPHKRNLTLMTCLTASIGESKRILVKGNFVYQTKFNHRWFDLFR
ncbi:class A sortase [Lentilactobacillus diolivorans]|uniref:class A sortase n=1 Tax=Lentilactobacillus diolivorans TaxID=179838 RepID=UPI002468CBDA|nr:class A sortase [Lentilactobacillus diolivorans]MDH5105803.1 class A sortase [Lentilactobacillus diolivorans]